MLIVTSFSNTFLFVETPMNEVLTVLSFSNILPGLTIDLIMMEQRTACHYKSNASSA